MKGYKDWSLKGGPILYKKKKLKNKKFKFRNKKFNYQI
jgi:hypothetical protein